uniref:Uncharacterized protein n=1 Tax=Candidatus Kentrum sp. FM TaxID=2126340 RepID=A0A450TF25_9GAMM|nr:MAG: Protein of unknown function (DUF2384) [Candidatus Kentron sp. FM]VFJ65739.1 MAG: Protein of unknown function (DUF2384) [Candidatus Kentron sp. FM]VFK15246.1 MAG: Protein of unknown function (DUF2384) [Candidatus Kentron sp. FM]
MTEWVGGRLLPPFFITEGDEPIRLEMILWLELPDDFIISHTVIDSREQEQLSFGDTLRMALESPMVGLSRRPERIRVADSRLAAEVREVLPNVKITVAPTPELNKILDLMQESMPPDLQEEEGESYFEKGRVSEAIVNKLFHATRRLYLGAPWKKVLSDTQVLALDIPALGVKGACISIIGTLGEHLGLVIFPSPEHFQSFLHFAQTHRQSDYEPIDMGTSMLSLYLERAAELPTSMRREAAKHGWPVADTAAYPRVTHRDADGIPRPLTERDVRVVTACALAVTDFFEKYPDALKDGSLSAPIRSAFRTEEDGYVEITALPGNILGDTFHHTSGDTFGDTSEDDGFEDLSPSEKAGIVLHSKQKHYMEWPERPLPALDGKTPRQAIRTKVGRVKVATLLDHFEETEAREPEGTRYDFSRLRRELGLDGP